MSLAQEADKPNNSALLHKIDSGSKDLWKAFGIEDNSYQVRKTKCFNTRYKNIFFIGLTKYLQILANLIA